MAKKTLLPPSSGATKREVSVNLRFSVEDHARLKQVAEYSGTTVANLLHYVTLNTTLPMMEQEVRRTHTAEQNRTSRTDYIKTAVTKDESLSDIKGEEKP